MGVMVAVAIGGSLEMVGLSSKLQQPPFCDSTASSPIAQTSADSSVKLLTGTISLISNHVSNHGPAAAANMADLATTILHKLDASGGPLHSSTDFPDETFDALKAALDRISSRSMITYEQIEANEWILEDEGQQIAQHGSHEARVFEALSKKVDGLTVQELEQEIGDKTVAKMGQGKAFKEKWITKGKDGKLVASVRPPPCLILNPQD